MNQGREPDMEKQHEAVLCCVKNLYEGLVTHDGFGDMRIEVRILKRGQKEVIIHCGKQYRFVVDAGLIGRELERENNKKATVSQDMAHQVNDFQ